KRSLKLTSLIISRLLRNTAQSIPFELSTFYCTEFFSRTCSLCSRLHFSFAGISKRKLLACITLSCAKPFGDLRANGSANLIRSGTMELVAVIPECFDDVRISAEPANNDGSCKAVSPRSTVQKSRHVPACCPFERKDLSCSYVFWRTTEKMCKLLRITFGRGQL